MVNKHILFLFPIGQNVPTGGLKMVYDYSDRLIRAGNSVTIAYAAYFASTDKTLARKIKAVAKYLYAKLKLNRNGYTWYEKDWQIKEEIVLKLNYNQLPKADVYVATAVCTAPYVAEFPVEDNRKFYFIQGYESFVVPDDSFIRWTYRLPLKKIVISEWLGRLVAEEGQTSLVVPNGFNPELYKLTIPVMKKDKFLVSMLYHVNENKDCQTGMMAVAIAREQIPELKLVMFGAYPEPQGLPEWVTYYQKPSYEKHLEINNQAAIYLGCSKKEGWGLTVGEAMMCGQAVVCTDIDGYKEMAVDGGNALLAPVGNAEALARCIVKLVNDDALRHKLAERGIESIKKFEIEESYSLFRGYILN